MDDLIRKRASIKAKLTRFSNFLTLENVKTNPNITDIKIRKEKANAFLDEFEQIQEQIESLSGDTNEDKLSAEKERSSFEQMFYQVLASAEAFVDQDPTNQTQINPQPIQQSQVLNPISQTRPQVKLPPITLMPFDGSYYYDKWNVFQDTYTALIHDNTALSEIEKFHYLRGSLTGDAQNILVNLETSSQNYQTAWNLVKERYENKKLITQTHIRALFELSSVPKENFEQLRTFLDTIQKHVRALTALGEPTSQWDSLILFLFSSKLDSLTRREWESKQSQSLIKLTFQNFCEFLQQKCNLLETLHRGSSAPSPKPIVQPSGDRQSKYYIHKKSNSFFSAQGNESQDKCIVCSKKQHRLFACDKFINMPPQDRSSEVKKHKLCFNCLGSDHKYEDCQASLCKKCSKKHNTLLHIDFHQANNHKGDNQKSENNSNTHFTGTSLCSTQDAHSTILLTTSVVEVFNQKGERSTCRVLLDSGFELNFITKQTCEFLGIKPNPTQVPINGIGNTTTIITEVATVTIKSRINSFQKTLNFMVLPKITSNLPAVSVNLNNFNIPSNLNLADPEFYKSSEINMLIGAEIYMDLLCTGQIKIKNHPTLHNTVFGWLLSGKTTIETPQDCFFVHHSSQMLNEQVQKFWELEEISTKPLFTQEEKECETHFQKTHTRDSDGRYIVRLPFKESPSKLGNSHDIALKRFNSLEKRLTMNSDLKVQYQHFMTEYQN